ncbi:hypothetical protein AALA82_13480, partial [Oscillospiraceae bacterium 50-16]
SVSYALFSPPQKFFVLELDFCLQDSYCKIHSRLRDLDGYVESGQGGNYVCQPGQKKSAVSFRE